MIIQIYIKIKITLWLQPLTFHAQIRIFVKNLTTKKTFSGCWKNKIFPLIHRQINHTKSKAINLIKIHRNYHLVLHIIQHLLLLTNRMAKRENQNAFPLNLTNLQMITIRMLLDIFLKESWGWFSANSFKLTWFSSAQNGRLMSNILKIIMTLWSRRYLDLRV